LKGITITSISAGGKHTAAASGNLLYSLIFINIIIISTHVFLLKKRENSTCGDQTMRGK
jgi:hypothetical protein